MAPKKKKQTKSGSKVPPKKASAKASTTTRSAVTKKPAAKATEPTRKQPVRKAAQATRREEPPANDADAGEESDREGSPPRKLAPKRATRKRKTPEDGEAGGEDELTAGPATHRPASKKAKPDKGKGKVTDTQRGSKRPRSEASGDEDSEDEDDVGPSKRNKRRREADAPGSTDSADRPADDADADANAAVDEEDAEDPWEEVGAPLATTVARVECMFQEMPAELIVSIKVFNDPYDFTSRLGYLARLRLARTDADGQQLDDVIGYIQAWRISKPTTTVPDVNPEWQGEILSAGAKHEAMEETALCLQALFTQDGTPRPALKGNTAQVEQDPLMFIQMIYTRHRFQRNGLLRPALDGFYTAIAQLPQWFAFAGTLVLVPSAPADYKGAVWEGTDDRVVEKTLIRVYTRCGYAVWVRNAVVDDMYVTVMGRATP